MQKRWSICDVPQEGLQEFGAPQEQKRTEDDNCSTPTDETGNNSNDNNEAGSAKTCKTFEGYPLRKCRSSFDLAMDSLRKEISVSNYLWAHYVCFV
ncbi:uncharacterized protein CEXT_120491 [Caerostris extrusa]|uniref:Uncharacterized protein n=1 Tax=Caerostris extrusa TaxID=172846 RepID=A0AAV4VV02_CAEEX|nr:uncharacterized protein CEXT_120491 [Caerostris extrusa]